jgi:hypothetical protein
MKKLNNPNFKKLTSGYLLSLTPLEFTDVAPTARKSASVLLSLKDFLLLSPQQDSGVVLYIKLFSLIFSIFLLLLIIILVIKSDRLWKVRLFWESKGVVNLPKDFDKAWIAIQRRLAKGDEANIKLAVIEADRMFNRLLYFMGYRDRDMADKLKQMNSAQLSNIEDIWLAHKVRNRIVHEPGHHLTRSEAESAITAFEKAFKEFEVL